MSLEEKIVSLEKAVTNLEKVMREVTSNLKETMVRESTPDIKEGPKEVPKEAPKEVSKETPKDLEKPKTKPRASTKKSEPKIDIDQVNAARSAMVEALQSLDMGSGTADLVKKAVLEIRQKLNTPRDTKDMTETQKAMIIWVSEAVSKMSVDNIVDCLEDMRSQVVSGEVDFTKPYEVVVGSSEVKNDEEFSF